MEARQFSCVLLVGLLWLCGCFGNLISDAKTNMTLHKDEIAVLRTIGIKLLVKIWDFGVDPCSGHEQVLKRQKLAGILPEEFANLASLKEIDLTGNYINGTIPASWASLRLVNIILLENRISGKIPDEITEIGTLKELKLENNLLEGPLPSGLGKLTNLTNLQLSANKFSGELPSTMARLKCLSVFTIDGNAFSGRIPSFIGSWTNLTRLKMQGTSLEGPFPAHVFTALTNLTELRVSDIGGGREFPSLEKNTKLNCLILRNCSITGKIPTYVGHMDSLKQLDLSFNSFTGEIPETFRQLVATIEFMYLTNNVLNGSIPNWIFGNSGKLDLSYNSFTGPPQNSCPQENLNLVSSFSSSKSDKISPCLRKNFPCAQNSTNYKLFINCGGREMTIDNEKYEEDSLDSGASKFFLSEDGRWAYSSTGNFDGNEEGSYIANNISMLNMTNPELHMMARLTPLSLRYYGLCLQEGNYTVKLHFAEIMFTNDQTFSALYRRIFDVYIQGKKILEDFNIAKEANGTGRPVTRPFVALVGPDGTLEIHFHWVGKGTNVVSRQAVYGPLISAISVTPNFEPDMGVKKPLAAAVIGIDFASYMLGLVIALIVLCWIKKHKKGNGMESLTRNFSLRHIRSATNNFDPVNKIGEGGFGPVYKGQLPDGTLIAVKQLSSKSKQGNREFLNEVGIISAVQHPNLVKLFGCCVGGNELLLIYEYLENNSLARALFGPEGTTLNLPWHVRRKISLDIGRGLVYLHEESKLKIVHGDIKATNILLDKDLNAKISDFGLAKLDLEENTHISTRIAGTVGYMAPEYALRGHLTDKADVYSFGIVLLEIVSGRSNTNRWPRDEFLYLIDRAIALQEQGKMLELVDPVLDSNYSKEEAEQMLQLALVCTNESPTLRPTMSDVVSMLEGKMPIHIPSKDANKSENVELRLNSSQEYSHNSLEMGTLADGPWANSSNTSVEVRSATRSLSTDITEE